MLLPLFLCTLLHEEGETRKPYRIAWNRMLDRDAMAPGVVTMLLSISYSCVGSYLAIYGEARGVADIGLYFTVYAVALLAARPVSGMLADRYGFIPMILPGIICFGLSFWLLSISQHLPAFLAAAMASAFGYGICQPQVQALTIRCVPKDRRGVGSNTNFFFMDCGMLIGPVIAGTVIDKVPQAGVGEADAYARMFQVMMIPMAVALLYLLVKKRRIEKLVRENQGT